jgi:hypothetical protein
MLIVAAVCVGLALVFGPASQSISRQDPGDGGLGARPAGGALDFEYQFGTMGDGEAPRYFGQLPALQSGERFTVRVRPQQAVFAYLFVTDGRGRYTLLPSDTDDGVGTFLPRDRWSRVPDERAVLRLDENRGVERVYLVVSKSRVPEIERLVEDEQSVSDDWLIDLRTRVVGRGRWTRTLAETAVRASYTGAIAVEDAAFRHR